MTRRLLWGTGLLALAVVLVVVAGVVLGPRPTSDDTVAGAAPAGRTTAQGVDADVVAELEARVERLPGDFVAWASLASARVELARVSGDPSQYDLAERAVERSLEVQPDDNHLAHLAASRLAAARHDFATALDEGEQAVAIAEANAEARLAVADAEIELGRYDAAEDSLQEALDRRPGFAALTRVSYLRELRGDVDGAVTAMTDAAALAGTPADRAFAAHHLGQLAFDRGELDEAESGFEQALVADPGWVAPAAGLARVAAARGDLAGAMRAWDEVLVRLPLPEYLAGAIDTAVAADATDRVAELEAILDAQVALLADAGVTSDLELALAEADRGDDPERAVAAARAEWDRRETVHTADALAWALHAAGRDAEALPYADRAVALGTRSAVFHFHRAEIQRALGDDGAAAASYREALAINPTFSPRWAPVAEDGLAALTP